METYGCGVEGGFGGTCCVGGLALGGREGRRVRKEETSEWAEKDKQQTGASASQENARDRVSTKRRINKQDSKGGRSP